MHNWQDKLRAMWAEMALVSIFLTSDGKWACRVTMAGQTGSHSFSYAAGTIEEAVNLAYARWQKEAGVTV